MRWTTASWDRVPLAAVGLVWAGLVAGGLGYAWWSATWALLGPPAPMAPPADWGLWAVWVTTGAILAWMAATTARALAVSRRSYLQLRRRLTQALAPRIHGWRLPPFYGVPPGSLVDGSLGAAFTWGFWRPQVVIADTLWQRLADPEREAVLWHEMYHRCRRDPAQQAILEVLVPAFGWVGLSTLWRYYIVHRELMADQAAIAGCQGDKGPLLRALAVAVALADDAEVASSPGMRDAWHYRFAYLDAGVWPYRERRALGYRLLVTALSVAVLVAESAVVLCH